MRLVDYDPGWPQEFAQEAARVRAVLGARALAVDHDNGLAEQFRAPGQRNH